MRWDPDTYLRWADHRARPGLELIARIPDIEPADIVDLGCGTGDLTTLLAERFGGARVIGVDSSAEMLDRTEPHPRVRWLEATFDGWNDPADLIFSNAALHWSTDHPTLFPRLAGLVRPGGVLAVQMPDNWAQPTHRIPARILDTGDWPDRARRALARDRVAAPATYRAWIGPGYDIDLWTTTYHHALDGPDPVLDWVTGSLLKPVLDVLDPASAARFRQTCADAYRGAYPAEADGTVVLPFRRLFIVAQRR